MLKDIRFSITAKLTVFVVVMVVVTALAVSFVYSSGSEKILLDKAVQDIEQEVNFLKEPLTRPVRQMQTDVDMLSKLPPIQGIIRAENNNGIDRLDNSTRQEWLNRLAIIFRAILETRPDYSQIRYIGLKNKGMELLRIDREGDIIKRIPESKLQAKGDRDYFLEIIKMQQDDVYLSEINLNRDFGKISEPYSLVVRSAVPVFSDTDKKLFGFVIINSSYGKVMERMAKRGRELSKTMYIINQNGDYMLHNDPSKLYATDLGHNNRIQQDYPSLLRWLDSDDVESKTIIPSNEEGNVLSFLKYHYDENQPERYLAVLLKMPYESIMGKVEGIQQSSYLAGIAIAVVAAIFAALFLRFLLLPLGIIASAVIGYREGRKDIPLPLDSPDEIGILAREFKDMVKSKKDEDWVKENLVGISKELLGFEGLKSFSDKLMERLVPTIGAHVGVIYIDAAYMHKGYGIGENLILLGSYAYTGDVKAMSGFKWGEGLIGQCAKSKTHQILKDTHNNNLHIVSGISDVVPRSTLIFPVQFKNMVIAVIELASTRDFSEIQLDFINQVSFNVGVIINGISASMRTEELLEEARETAEELKRNEEELKTQQEELQSSNEEMEEKTKSLEEQNEKIKTQSEELEESRNLIAGKVRELEMSNKYKSEFLANISHELRTPLNSLLILAKSLHDNEEKNLTAEQVEEVGIIYNGGMDLLTLINDILDLSKVEAGKITISASKVSPVGIADNMKRQFTHVAGQANVAFNISVAKDLPEYIYTDSQRVEQILKNLLSNAFKFTEKGSVFLKIYKPDEKTAMQSYGTYGDSVIAFDVSDTGIGIAEDKLRDIFEAFQQEDGSIDRHYGGTGLGLTISRKFAYLLGGEIQVKSIKGKGSTFTVYIAEKYLEKNNDTSAKNIDDMKISEPNKKLLTKYSADSVNHQKQVLIIEDDKDFARVLAKQAEDRGYKAIIANNGKTGLLKATEQEISAIILDLRLPDIGGAVILEQLKSNAKLCDIPVHVITGIADNDNSEIIRKGAVTCLSKPLDKEDIASIFANIKTMSGDGVKEVIVVEDDKKTQAAVKKLLKRDDIRITMVASGKNALESIKKKHYDCAILDLSLPDIDGFKWLSQLEKLGKSQAVPPVVVYTAKELSATENTKLNQYTGSIVIKGVSASERLLDEVTLFLHSIEPYKSNNVSMQHATDKVLRGKKILLTDDDLRNSFAISKMLKKHGMEVIIADNGEMALDKLKHVSGIDLVIMDIMMPVMDGYEAIKAIRKQSKFEKLPVIALTARAMPEEQDKCMEAGANDYMTKPVDIEKLVTLMRLWLFKQDKVA